MSIRDKLSLYRTPAAENTASRPSLESIGAETVRAGGCLLWRFTRAYPLPAPLADYRGKELLEPYGKFNRLPFIPEPEQLLFFDLETTSLSTGSGSYPFLTGVGYISEKEFVVEQYFMDDYSAEGAILEKVLPFFRDARAVVCFNGKSFDLPLIKNRYRLNRVPGFPVDIPTIDLLYPCRRVFRRVHGSCSLSSMEEKVLGIFRKDDIPGWLIPEVYFSYSRHGELDRLPLVVEHNAQDIYSMLRLLLLLNDLYASLKRKRFHEFQRQSLHGLVSQLYSVDLTIFLDVMDFLGDEVWTVRPLFRKYTGALKRTGRTGEALAFWEKNGSPWSLEELAKHYEHRKKDPCRALGYASRLMDTLGAGGMSLEGLRPGETEAMRARTVKRIERLNRRAGNS
ncbi:MAG TPA: hypothetical protein ENN21_05000 [Spirochaetes bacterium]|nr:hypothetical protein [Spirochaetota bacterium]